jgi:hypothetical protein
MTNECSGTKEEFVYPTSRKSREAHDSSYSIHPGGNKMYQDLKVSYWWYGMKREFVEYVTLCNTCQRVKEEHQ